MLVSGVQAGALGAPGEMLVGCRTSTYHTQELHMEMTLISYLNESGAL